MGLKTTEIIKRASDLEKSCDEKCRKYTEAKACGRVHPDIIGNLKKDLEKTTEELRNFLNADFISSDEMFGKD